MKIQKILAVLALTAAGSGAAPAFAQSLKCGQDFSKIGDSKADIALKCAAPVYKDAFCQAPDPTTVPPTANGVIVRRQACVNVDEWTYNPGYGQFMTTLRFENGVLHSVRYGDRVR